MTVWPYLLLACAFAAIWNIKLAVVFACHILTMQLIKWYNPPQIQGLFAASYTIWALVAYMVGQKIGAFFLATISLIYLAHILGMVYQYPKIILAELLFILGLFGGAISGNHTGVLAFIADIRIDRRIDSIQDLPGTNQTHQKGNHPD